MSKKLSQGVIDRLRASKAETSDEKQGAEAGRAWAEDVAEHVELQRLAKAAEAETLDFEAEDPARAFLVVIAGSSWAANGGDYYGFWQNAKSEGHSLNSEYLRAFVEAALEVHKAFEESDAK